MSELKKGIRNQISLNRILIKLAEYFKHEKVRQIVILYLVNILGIPLGIFTSIVITKYLGAEIYGDYSLIINIFSFSLVLFTFGFFQAGNRALVLNQDKEKAREIYGAVLVLLFFLFILMSICLSIYGILDLNLKTKQLTNIFLFFLPFGWIFLLTNYFETLFQADNRIYDLAKTRLYPKIGFFISALVIYFFFSKIEINKLVVVLSLYLVTFLIVYLATLRRIKISFRGLKTNIKEVWGYNKSFGFDVYIGSVLSVGLTSLSGVIISYFGEDNTGVGFYTLALTFASPLTLIPNVIATTHYKEFALQNKIPTKLTFLTIGLTTTTLLLLWAIVGPFILFFYGASFSPVIQLNLIVSTGIAFHGLADYYNRFLGAHGQGKSLRNGSIFVGLSILTMNLVFIPLWDETGAAVAKLVSGIIYFANMYYYYSKLKRSLNTKLINE